jgi:hypothetical protein
VGVVTNSTPTTFKLLPLTSLQQGNAVVIYTASSTNSYMTDTNNYVIYYLDTSMAPTNYLKQYMHSNNSGTIRIITLTMASYITNQTIFYAENCWGDVVSNYLNDHQIVRMVLQFSQWEYPIARVVAGNSTNNYNAYDYYQLRTRVFRRSTQ